MDEEISLVCDRCGEPFEEGQAECLNPSCPEGAYNIAMDRGDELYHASVDRQVMDE